MNKGAIVAYGESSSVQKSDLLSEVFAVDLAVGTMLASETPLVIPHGGSSTRRPRGEFALADPANRELRSAPHDPRPAAALIIRRLSERASGNERPRLREVPIRVGPNFSRLNPLGRMPDAGNGSNSFVWQGVRE